MTGAVHRRRRLVHRVAEGRVLDARGGRRALRHDQCDRFRRPEVAEESRGRGELADGARVDPGDEQAVVSARRRARQLGVDRSGVRPPRVEGVRTEFGRVPKRQGDARSRPFPGDGVEDVGVAADRREPAVRRRVRAEEPLDCFRRARRRPVGVDGFDGNPRGDASAGVGVEGRRQIEAGERRADGVSVARDGRANERRVGDAVGEVALAVHRAVGRHGDAGAALDQFSMLGGLQEIGGVATARHLAGGDDARECEHRVDVGGEFGGGAVGVDARRAGVAGDGDVAASGTDAHEQVVVRARGSGSSRTRT
ncbi:hypothetical protein ACFQJD_05180 [Haloplanus sp. GCM10025708]